MAIGAPFSSPGVATRVRLLPAEIACIRPTLERGVWAFNTVPTFADHVMKDPRHMGYLPPERYWFWREAEDGLDTKPPLAIRRLLNGIESGAMPEWYVAYAARAEMYTHYHAGLGADGIAEVDRAVHALDRYAYAIDRGAAPLMNTGLAIDRAALRPVAGLPLDLSTTVTSAAAAGTFFTGRLLVPDVLLKRLAWDRMDPERLLPLHNSLMESSSFSLPYFNEESPGARVEISLNNSACPRGWTKIDIVRPASDRTVALLMASETQETQWDESAWARERVEAFLAGVQSHLLAAADTMGFAGSWDAMVLRTLTDPPRLPDWLTHLVSPVRYSSGPAYPPRRGPVAKPDRSSDPAYAITAEQFGQRVQSRNIWPPPEWND